MHAYRPIDAVIIPCPVDQILSQVHAYVHGPEGRTAYLSELASGSEAVVVDASGAQRTATVGRVKIETRPLVRDERIFVHSGPMFSLGAAKCSR